MKTFNEFLSESINISGNASVGTIIVNSDQESKKPVGEEFYVDLVWRGQLYRMEMISQEGLPTRESIAHQLQPEYPGVIIQQIYPKSAFQKTIDIKDKKVYNFAQLRWVDG